MTPTGGIQMSNTEAQLQGTGEEVFFAPIIESVCAVSFVGTASNTPGSIDQLLVPRG